MAQVAGARGFRALVDFRCDELNCPYTEGLTYTVRVGNDALGERVEQWVADGIAEWTHDEDGPAFGAVLSGAGTVN